MKQFIWDYKEEVKPLKSYWNMCVGSCHGTTALRQDYREQLEKCQRELGFRYVRFHGLFDDDMSVLTRPMMGAADEWVVSFTNVDSVFDFLLSINMKPFVEIGFMPEALKSKDTTIFHYKGNTSRPASYEKWEWLIGLFAEHLTERYGTGEVRQWFFEVWNEPNLGGPDSPFGFWSDTMEEYFNLYSHTAHALKEVDERLKVGGPATSNNSWIPELLNHCSKTNTPIDFISTHHYPTDVILGYGVEDSQNFMTPGEGETVEAFLERRKEQHKHLWEKVDRGALTQMTVKAVGEAGGLPVYYTEWNSGAGIASDGPFGSSFILKTIMDSTDLVEGYSYWTFSDIFEEGGMPCKPFHGGFGLLNLQGIPKASYRAFQLLHKLGEEMYVKTGAQGTVDVYGVRKNTCRAVQFLAVNHHSLLHDITEEEIQIRLTGASPVKVTIERLDDTHGNALACWQAMGEPEYPDRSQLALLEAASYTKEETAQVKDGTISLALPPMGAALITMYL